MQFFLNIIIRSVLVLLIFIIHIIASNLLLPPFNYLNIIFITAISLLIFNKKNLFFYIFFISLLLELFMSTPWCLNTVALILSFIVIDWILLNLLTDRSVVTVLITSLVGMILYRIIFLSLLAVWNFIFSTTLIFDKTIFLDTLIISVVNTIAIILIYFIFRFFMKRLIIKHY